MQIEEENGSNNYQIRRLKKFDITYEALIKKHYRKDTKGRKEFQELVEDYLKKLEFDPCSDCISDKEPFPSDTAEQDFEFRKKR